MSIAVLKDEDARLSHGVRDFDPFQQPTQPCWQRRVWPQLPPETINTIVTISTKEVLHRMALRIIKESEAPAQASKRGTIGRTQEYSDVMKALRSIKPGEALIVTLESKEFTDGTIKKPELTFAYAFRRYFADEKVPYTAYQSGKMEVTVRKERK